jgi:hypothetical protein
MSLPLERRIDRLEKASAARRRPRYLFRGMDETWAQVEARMRAMIASGEASRDDQFVMFEWRSSADDGADD